MSLLQQEFICSLLISCPQCLREKQTADSCCFRCLGCFLHGDLCVYAAAPAAALQRSGVASANAPPPEAHGGRVRALPAAARRSGDGALVGAQPGVQIVSECPQINLSVSSFRPGWR